MDTPQHRPPRASLKLKLTAAMLTLVAVAVLVIGAVSTLLLRNYLLARVDDQLVAEINQVSGRIVRLSPHDTCTGELQFSAPELAIVLTNDECGVRPFLFTGDTAAAPRLPSTLDEAWSSVDGQQHTVMAKDGSRRWRVMSAQLPTGQVLTIGQDLSSVEHSIARLVLIDLLLGASVLITLAVAGGWIVRRSLRPLGEIERTAAAIAGGDLRQRVPDLGSRTEVGRLAGALNTMLAQIEQAFTARAQSEARAIRSEERMREFVADASHELRTPLTTIRGFAELYRHGAAGEPGPVIKRIEDEAARMGLLVEDLLLLARLDRERPLQMGPVGLTGLIMDAVDGARAVAPDRPIDADVPDTTPVVTGDEARLRQVIGNLLTNAITHTPPGTPVTVRLRAMADEAVIEVSDAGPGLTPDQAERVFERFYRVDKARTRQAASSGAGPKSAPHSGTGLGLAIVAALVAAHDGTVELDTEPGQGATFRVRLPLASGEPPVTHS